MLAIAGQTAGPNGVRGTPWRIKNVNSFCHFFSKILLFLKFRIFKICLTCIFPNAREKIKSCQYMKSNSNNPIILFRKIWEKNSAITNLKYIDFAATT